MQHAPFRRPGYYRHSGKRRTYRKILLAVYWLADDEGLICAASNADIAREAGVSADTAGAYLRDMEAEGTVSLFYDEGLPFRVIVLLDHPDAGPLVRKANRARRIAARDKRNLKMYWVFYDRLIKAVA